MDRKLVDRIMDNVVKESRAGKDYYAEVDLPQSYINKMKELGEKYRKVRWLPLDIPKIELDDIEEFKHFWEKESIDVLRVKPDVAEPWTKEEHPLKQSSSWYVPTFKGLHLYENEIASPISHDSFSGKLYKGSNKQLQRLKEQVFDYFPMHTMFAVFIWQSTREVVPHRDRGLYFNCPTEFRVMLHDENDRPTLYVADTDDREVYYIDCPPDTNSFCWSNGSQIHGSDYFGKKKWILCVAGAANSTKADELFTRSINKYRDKLNYIL